MATETKAQHTPGPWHWYNITGSSIQIGVEGKVTPVAAAFAPTDMFLGGDKMHNILMANARLIAAAPDLLAACEAALEHLGPGVTTAPLERQLRAAIAKATSK